MAWNKPTSNTVDATSSSRPAGRGKMPRLRRGLLAGAIVVLGTGIAAWLLTNGEATSSSLQKKERGRIKEAEPVVASVSTNLATRTREERPWPPPNAKQDEHGIWRYPSGQRVFDPRDRERAQKSPTKSNIPKFNHPIEREIATLLTVKPGMPLVGEPRYSTFKQDFINAMLDKVEITNEDSPRDKAIKEQVIEAKKELAERVRNGEDIVQILKDTRQEIQRLSQYKREMQNLINEQVRNAEVSDEDVASAFEAANKMLAEKGIAPIQPTLILRRRQQILINEARKNAAKQQKK